MTFTKIFRDFFQKTYISFLEKAYPFKKQPIKRSNSSLQSAHLRGYNFCFSIKLLSVS
ncbi:hypothetical protein HMPREF1869_00177 [Bacteroidales bacterium KA00251]|nr:hypothetical protein HMPREF1869_00177 [Bacteroidales bacterium KA00251]